jgi:hypothetical protein
MPLNTYVALVGKTGGFKSSAADAVKESVTFSRCDMADVLRDRLGLFSPVGENIPCRAYPGTAQGIVENFMGEVLPGRLLRQHAWVAPQSSRSKRWLRCLMKVVANTAAYALRTDDCCTGGVTVTPTGRDSNGRNRTVGQLVGVVRLTAAHRLCAQRDPLRPLCIPVTHL